MSITEQIRSRIMEMNDGDVFLTSDFADISSITTIRKCLGRYTTEGMIRRVFDGVYERPKYSKLLGEYLPTDPEKVENNGNTEQIGENKWLI